MDLEKTFKGLILLRVVIVGATFISALYAPYDEKYIEQGLSPVVYFGSVVSLVGMASLILLYKFIPWGRIIFTISIVLWVLSVFLSPEYYVPKGRIFDTLNWINGAVTGGIFAMLYLTEIKERFVRKI